MSFPRYGDQTAAWAITLTISGVTATEDIVVVQKDGILAIFGASTVGPVNLTQYEALIAKAVANIR